MTPADLRAARERLGQTMGKGRKLTQRELAELLRMGRNGWQSISAWESDHDPRNAPGTVALAIELLIARAEGWPKRCRCILSPTQGHINDPI